MCLVISLLPLSFVQAELSVRDLSRERLESNQPQPDRRTPPVSSPHHLVHPFGLTPSSVMQDPRIQSLR